LASEAQVTMHLMPFTAISKGVTHQRLDIGGCAVVAKVESSESHRRLNDAVKVIVGDGLLITC